MILVDFRLSSLGLLGHAGNTFQFGDLFHATKCITLNKVYKLPISCGLLLSICSSCKPFQHTMSSPDAEDAPSSYYPGLQSSKRESSLIDDSVAKQFSAEDESDEGSQDSIISPSRPNKFRGPPSTWRNWTAPERDIVAGLDQLQAKDLSVHLYNSFKLRQSNRIPDPSWQMRNSKVPGEPNQTTQWIPPKVWTAWPLPPGIVPREHDEVRWQEGAVSSVSHHSSRSRPGQHLREMLVAQILRTAKDRFHERQWEAAPLSETTTAEELQPQDLGRVAHGKPSAEHDLEIHDQKPVVMADDQRASEILQATVQHILTKLDDLLMGLHHARNANLPVEDSEIESHGETSERSKSRGRPQKKKRKAPKHDEGTEASHDVPDHPRSDSDTSNPSKTSSGSQRKSQHARSYSRRSQSQKFHDRKGRLGLRDWSDVLGIASMVGWHQDVVGNTTTRCARIFQEGIRFRTLREGTKVWEENLYLPNVPPLISSEHGQSDIGQAKEGLNNRLDGFLEPIEGKKSWMYSDTKQSKRRQSSRKSRV